MPVSRTIVKRTGASSTRPTWKNTGSPMMNADSMQRPVETPLAQRGDERARDDDRAARFSEKLADHRAEPDDDRDEAQCVADALLERAGNVGKRHPRGEPDEHRSNQQSDEGGDLQPGDEKNDQPHAEDDHGQQRHRLQPHGGLSLSRGRPETCSSVMADPPAAEILRSSERTRVRLRTNL